jgi:hypothetical protein
MRLVVNNLKEVGEGPFFLLAKESTYMGGKRADYVMK